MIGESFEEYLQQRTTVEMYQKIFFFYRLSIHILLELQYFLRIGLKMEITGFEFLFDRFDIACDKIYFDIPKPFPQKKFSVSILHYKIGFK